MVSTFNKPPTASEYKAGRPPSAEEYGGETTLPIPDPLLSGPPLDVPATGIPDIVDPQTLGMGEKGPAQQVFRPRWDELIDATARGEARVGSAAQTMRSRLKYLGGEHPITEPHFGMQTPAQRMARKKDAARLRKSAGFLWKLSQNPALASQNKDLASKALNLMGETIPYITATSAGYVTLGPMGGFTVGSMVEGNSAYRTALDAGVPESKAKKIGIGVGVISGAVEAFGGKYAEQFLLKAVTKLKTKMAKAGAVFGIGTVVEALEEGAQEIAAITGEETYRDVPWKERVSRVLSSMAGGGFLGGMMRGGSMAARGMTQEVAARIAKPPTAAEYQTPPTVAKLAPQPPRKAITPKKAVEVPQKAEVPPVTPEVAAEGITIEVYRGISSEKAPLDAGNWGKGKYYTVSENIAKAYARRGGIDEGKVEKTTLNLKNPMYVPDSSTESIKAAAKRLGVKAEPDFGEEGDIFKNNQLSDKFAKEFSQKAIEAGYDSLVAGEGYQVVVFEAQPPTKAEPAKVKEIKYEKEAITEPTPSPKVEPRKAGKLVPTGKLDPTDPKEALEITKLHAQFMYQEEGVSVGGIFEQERNEEGEKVITSIEYTSKQVDTAYRNVQKPVESPMPDTDLFAMPGKEAKMKAIAAKMAKVKGVVKPKKMGPKPLTKPTALPKAKTKKEDHVKAVYVATTKEGSRYAINGVLVEGDNLVATDGRRMFWAKGKWGKDGVYLDAAALKKGSLGKLDKTGQKFPTWKDIIPDVSDVKPIMVDLEAALSHVRQAAVVTSEESAGITIIENKDERMGLGFAAAAPEVGHAEINVYPGGRILGAVNPRFLMDAIKFHAIRGDTVIEFYYKNFDRPILTRSPDGKTNTITMPVNPDEPSEAIKEAISEWPTKSKGKEPKDAGGFLTIPFRTPSPEALREGAEKIYQDYINRFASIENTVKKAARLGMKIRPGENPTLRAREYLSLARKVEEMLSNKTFRITPEGKIEITGEGLKPILDDFDKRAKVVERNKKRRKKDWQEYLEATRVVKDLQRPAYEGAPRNIASPGQVKEAGRILTNLGKKYQAKGMAILENASERLYEYQKRILNLLVDAGNLSRKQFNVITNLNRHYIPFDRVIEGVTDYAGAPVSKKRFTEARAPVRKIKGSELEIHDFVESVIKNTYRIVEAAERNTVAASVAKLGKVLPEISPVRVKMYPIRVDPKEILTVVREFRSQSSKILEDIKTIKEEGGADADLTGPAKKLETVVKDALTHRGFSPSEANSFVAQIRKQGKGIAPGAKEEAPKITTETIRQVIKETQKTLISKEPVESTIFRASQFKPKGNVIEYFVKGKRKYMEVPPNLYQAMTGLNEGGASFVIKILSKPAHWLRIGATITPEFMLRNPIRDQYTALMQTSFGFIPFFDSIGAIADIIGKTSVYHDWLRAGGAYSGFVELNRPSLMKSAKELTKSRTRRLLGKLNIISDAQDLSQLFERATRLGVYKRAVKKGMAPVEAAFESREATIDFLRRGGKMADVNRVIAFFNAGVQAFDKNIRNAINHPYSTAIKGVMAITLPSLLLYMRNRKDPEYKEIPRWQKDLFWIVKLGGIHFRIIKPFFYGQIFGSLPERFFEYLDTKDPKSFKEIEKSLLESISPVSGSQVTGLLPTAVKPIIENIANKNFFLDRPVYPRSTEGLAPPEQHGRYVSETAKQLGKWLNYSPAKIENLIRGYSGGTGRYALEGVDTLANAIRKAAGEPVAPKRPRELADIPLVKGFVIRPATGPQAQSIQDFYEKSQKILVNDRTYKKMRRERRNKEAQQLLAKHPEIRLSSRLSKELSRMSGLSMEYDKIIKSKMTEQKKRDAIKSIDSKRLYIARRANKLMERPTRR